MSENNKLYKTKKSNFIPAIGFLAFVVILSAGFFSYNKFLENKSSELKTEISNLENSISERQKEKDLQIYNLISLNKNSIDLLIKNSKVTKFISHLKVISSKYGINFRGFNYSNGVIVTSIKLASDENGLAYNRATNFIKSYRGTSEALFELDFINNFSGHDRMSFDVKFNVK